VYNRVRIYYSNQWQQAKYGPTKPGFHRRIIYFTCEFCSHLSQFPVERSQRATHSSATTRRSFLSTVSHIPHMHPLRNTTVLSSPFYVLFDIQYFLATRGYFLVHGQVTIIFVVSVCLFVCLFVCAEFFSAIFGPISIKLGHMLYVWV